MSTSPANSETTHTPAQVGKSMFEFDLELVGTLRNVVSMGKRNHVSTSS
jgi:hypothetical protein